MPECIFCNIINGKLSAEIVYNDDEIVAFRDVQPQAPTHILICPREHVEDLNNFDNDALTASIFRVARQLAVSEGISETGYRVVANCREAGGQTVYHVHFHLLGGRDFQWPPG